jgi:hypothetical protein
MRLVPIPWLAISRRRGAARIAAASIPRSRVITATASPISRPTAAMSAAEAKRTPIPALSSLATPSGWIGCVTKQCRT